MSDNILEIQTTNGTFSFVFNSADRSFAESAINDALFNQCSWISAEQIDFAHVFEPVRTIRVERTSLATDEGISLDVIRNKQYIGVVFYTGEMQAITAFLDSLGKDEQGVWRPAFVKAFHAPQYTGEISNAAALFYEVALK